MKRSFLILGFLFTVQVTISQSSCAVISKFEFPELPNLNSRSLLITSAKSTSKNAIACVHALNYADFGQIAIKSIRAPQLANKSQQSDINEIKIKMNALIERRIDLLFKHSFTTKQSLVILFVPFGKNKWPFGKT